MKGVSDWIEQFYCITPAMARIYIALLSKLYNTALHYLTHYPTLYNIALHYPFMHTFIFWWWCPPCKATTSSPGGVNVSCSSKATGDGPSNLSVASCHTLTMDHVTCYINITEPQLVLCACHTCACPTMICDEYSLFKDKWNQWFSGLSKDLCCIYTIP